MTQGNSARDESSVAAYEADDDEPLVTDHRYENGSWRLVERQGIKAQVGVCVCGRDFHEHGWWI